MEKFDFKYAGAKLLKMITSRVWLNLLFAGLAVSGIDIAPEWQAFAFLTLAGIYAAVIYKEGQSDNQLLG